MAARIVGLAGAAGAGKNTVGDILFRHGYANFGFADPVYRAVSAITGMPEESLRNRAAKESPIEWLGKSPRELLQTLGTEWGREMIREDIWIRIAMRQANALIQYGVGVCITDVRFANEAEAIRAEGGQVWLVKRPVAALKGDAASHSSEAGIPPGLVDEIIENDGTIDDLNARVEGLIQVK